ncbi:hypothetical protein PSEUDO9AG_41342 [Pseudomonas sp. 9Ag]|nr:hypothetical protein PSEUDO9AG_41342 [Pseudomonas sp. 9Ag]
MTVLLTIFFVSVLDCRQVLNVNYITQLRDASFRTAN